MSPTLVVSNDFPPRVGGIESFVAAACRMLDHDVVVLTSRGPGSVAATADHDAALPYEVVRRDRVLLPTAAVAREAATLLRRHRADRVLFGAAAPLGLLAPTLRRAGAVRQLALSHGHEVWWATLPGSRGLLRRIGDGVDHLGVISDHTRRRIVPALSPTARSAVLTLPPPVDLAVFRPAEAPAPARVVAAGRLVAQKGIDVLLRAWAAQPTGPPAGTGRELVVVGDGSQRRRLEGLVRSLGIVTSVRLVGAVPHAELPALLRTAQVFALPVRTRLAGLNPEGLGLAAVEAAACGLPVLIGRSGGAPETVRDGVSGHVLDPYDVAAWAAALDRLLADPDGAAAMGRAGRAYVGERFGLPVVRRTLRSALGLST